MDNPTIATISFAAAHFAFILLAIVLTFRNGVTPFWLIFPITVTLSCACLTSIDYWDTWQPSLTNWSMVGGWGFIVLNFVLFLCSAFALDAYTGAKRDILGRALSRTAGKVFRQGKRKAEKEEEFERRRRENLLRSDNAPEVPESHVIKNPEFMASSSPSGGKTLSEPLYVMDNQEAAQFSVEDGYSQKGAHDVSLGGRRHSDVLLGGSVGSSLRNRFMFTSGGDAGSQASDKEDEDEEAQPAGEEESRRVRRRMPPSTPKEEGLDLIARTLPKKVFGIETEQKFDPKTLEWFEMGDDIGEYVQGYLRRMYMEAIAYYVLSVLVLIGMAVAEEMTSDKVTAWFNVGWIILGDSILLLRLLQPQMTAHDRKQLMAFSSTLDEESRGWNASLPNESRVPRLWMLALVLFITRGVLVTVPVWLSFGAQCIAYVFCGSYLSIYSISEYHKTKRLPRLPFALLIVFTVWLALDTAVIAMSAISDTVAYYLGGQRVFQWQQHTPIHEWILGLASVSLVISIALIHNTIWYVRRRRARMWVSVYLMFCLTGFALDCIASNTVSLELGVFVTVAFAFPYAFVAVLALKECFVSKTRKLRSRLLCFYLTLGVPFGLGWGFSLQAVNADEVSFLVFVIPCEVQTIVCFLCFLALQYNCVERDYAAWYALGLALACYSAILPISFAVSSSDGDDIWTNTYLGVALVTFLLIPMVLLWAVCSVQLVDLGWEFIFKCVPQKRRLAFQAMLVTMGLCAVAAMILTGLIFGVPEAVWLATVVLLFLFITSALQARFLTRPFSRTEVNVRVVVLTVVAFALFVLSLVDSQTEMALKHLPKVNLENEDSWTNYLLAGSVLFAFACLDYVVSMFNSIPNEIISPSENLFGFPIVRYVIERKGGELFVYNSQIEICCASFIALDAVGFIVGLAPSTTDTAKNWGLVLSCVAFCLIALLGMHMKHFRLSQFRRDLSQVNLTSPLAEDAFAQVLKDTVGKIRQFSTRTTIFPSATRKMSKTEEKQKSLAFFYFLFSLASKRKIRSAKQARAIALQITKTRAERLELAKLKEQAELKEAEQEQHDEQSQKEKQFPNHVDDTFDGGDSTTAGTTTTGMKSVISGGPTFTKSSSSSSRSTTGIGRGGKEEALPATETEENREYPLEAISHRGQSASEGSHPDMDQPGQERSSSSSSLHRTRSSSPVSPPASQAPQKEGHESTSLGGPPPSSSPLSKPIISAVGPAQVVLDETKENVRGLPIAIAVPVGPTEPASGDWSALAQQQSTCRCVASASPHQHHHMEPLSSRRRRHLTQQHLTKAPVTNAPELFYDVAFPPSYAIVFQDWDSDLDSTLSDFVQDEEELCLWLRPTEICGNKPWGLLSPREDLEAIVRKGEPPKHLVDPRQVKQGNVADCWLLSALSVVALKQDLFARVLPATCKQLDGKYSVRLFDFRTGDWVEVIVDDRLPCDPETREPMFASSRSGSVFWISIIEKAFAKRMGGWVNLHEGQVHRALVDLTGGFSQLYSCVDDFELVESGAMWATILSLSRAGHLLVLGSTSRADLFGLVSDHAYAVLSVIEMHDSRGRHRLMQLQDPWGKSEWKGAWSESDEKSWTPRALWSVRSQQEGHHHEGEKDAPAAAAGTFWMEFDDVLMHFQWLFTCRLFASEEGWIHHDVIGEWNRRTAGGPPNQAKTRHNPQFKLVLRRANGTRKRKRAVVFISICNLADLPVYPYMSLLVLNLDGKPVNAPVVGSQVVASTGKFKDARELSIEVALPVGKTFTLLPTLNRIGDFGSFRLSCYAKCPFDLEPF